MILETKNILLKIPFRETVAQKTQLSLADQLSRMKVKSPSSTSEPSSTNRVSLDEKKSATEKKSVEGPAKMVLVTSTGAAADWVGGYMGVFLLAGEHNNRPYYRQKHTLDTEGARFLYSHDIWYLGCE